VKRASSNHLHPAQRFVAPSTIERGTPLAAIVGPKLIALVGESLAAVEPTFDVARFEQRAAEGLEPLGLMQRAAHVADALAEQLPADFDDAVDPLVASLGPELARCEGNGLTTFYYLPHSFVIAKYGVARPDAGLRACYELTKRFTAEFCIRPFLIERPTATLRVLKKWTADASPHVRRLVSEGTRSRLPWGLRLRVFQDDPRPTLALLEKLKDDPEPYVRRSVANHLGDVFKDNPTLAYEVCERWLAEAAAARFDPLQAKSRLALIRHAVRLPAKKGDPAALELRGRAK